MTRYSIGTLTIDPISMKQGLEFLLWLAEKGYEVEPFMDANAQNIYPQAARIVWSIWENRK